MISSVKCPKGTRLFHAFSFAFFLVMLCTASVCLQAQVYTPSVSYDPGNYSIGDTVSIYYSVGDPTAPLENVSVLEMEYSDTDQIFVDAGIQFDPTGSWFVSPGDSFTVETEIRDNGHTPVSYTHLTLPTIYSV